MFFNRKLNVIPFIAIAMMASACGGDKAPSGESQPQTAAGPAVTSPPPQPQPLVNPHLGTFRLTGVHCDGIPATRSEIVRLLSIYNVRSLNFISIQFNDTGAGGIQAFRHFNQCTLSSNTTFTFDSGQVTMTSRSAFQSSPSCGELNDSSLLRESLHFYPWTLDILEQMFPNTNVTFATQLENNILKLNSTNAWTCPNPNSVTTYVFEGQAPSQP